MPACEVPCVVSLLDLLVCQGYAPPPVVPERAAGFPTLSEKPVRPLSEADKLLLLTSSFETRPLEHLLEGKFTSKAVNDGD